jgi:hypothetical protein
VDVGAAFVADAEPPVLVSRMTDARLVWLRQLVAGHVVLGHLGCPIDVRIHRLSVGEATRVKARRTGQLFLAGLARLAGSVRICRTERRQRTDAECQPALKSAPVSGVEKCTTDPALKW